MWCQSARRAHVVLDRLLSGRGISGMERRLRGLAVTDRRQVFGRCAVRSLLQRDRRLSARAREHRRACVPSIEPRSHREPSLRMPAKIPAAIHPVSVLREYTFALREWQGSPSLSIPRAPPHRATSKVDHPDHDSPATQPFRDSAEAPRQCTLGTPGAVGVHRGQPVPRRPPIGLRHSAADARA